MAGACGGGGNGTIFVVGNGENSRLYDIYLPGRDMLDDENCHRNPCTSEMDISTLYGLQMKYEKLEDLQMQVDTLLRHGIYDLDLDKDNIPAAVDMAKAELKSEKALEKLMNEHCARNGQNYDMSSLFGVGGRMSSRLCELVKVSVLESIENAEADIRKFLNTEQLEKYTADLYTLRGRISVIMDEELNFKSLKEREEICSKMPCCIDQISKRTPSPEKQPPSKNIQVDRAVCGPSNLPANGKLKSTLPSLLDFPISEYFEPDPPESSIVTGDVLECRVVDTKLGNFGHDRFSLYITAGVKIELDTHRFFASFRKDKQYENSIREKLEVGHTWKIGQYVLAKKTSCDQYDRALVVAVLHDEKKVDLYFLDYGVRRIVPYSYTTNMPYSLLKSPAMAIRCTLRPGKLLTDPKETGPVFKDILNTAVEMKATFRSFSHDKEIGTKVWEVSLAYCERSGGRLISIRDELQRKLAKKLKVRVDEEDDSDDGMESLLYYLDMDGCP